MSRNQTLKWAAECQTVHLFIKQHLLTAAVHREPVLLLNKEKKKKSHFTWGKCSGYVFFFFFIQRKKKWTFSWVQIFQGGAGGVQRILYRLEPPHTHTHPCLSVYLIQSELSLLSLKTRLQHEGKKMPLWGFFFFSYLLLLKVQSRVVAGRWPSFRLPPAPSETENSEDDKRQGFSAVTFWSVNKSVLQVLMDGRGNSCVSWRIGG